MNSNSELGNYLARIEDLRHQISGLLAECPSEALNWRPMEAAPDSGTNSLAALAAHVAGAEHFWIGEVVGGRPATRDREAEFATRATATSELISLLESLALETREVLSTLSESDLNGTRRVKDRIVPVRWCLLHIVDHSALHLGHMQITYQLWSGGKSIASPLWMERLPQDRGDGIP